MAPADENFITAIQNLPVIWNKTHPQHHNRWALAKAWDKIAADFCEDKKIVKNKWKSLTNRLRKEAKLIPVTKSGAAASNYSSKWNLFESMKFFLDQQQPNRSEGNLSRVVDDDEELEENNEVDDIDYEVEETSEEENLDQLKMSKRRSAVNTSKSLNKGKSGSNNKADKENEMDSTDNEHLLFFKTLLPHINNMEDSTILLFRQEITSLVLKHAYNVDKVTSIDHANKLLQEAAAIKAKSHAAGKARKRALLNSMQEEDEDCQTINWRITAKTVKDDKSQLKNLINFNNKQIKQESSQPVHSCSNEATLSYHPFAGNAPNIDLYNQTALQHLVAEQPQPQYYYHPHYGYPGYPYAAFTFTPTLPSTSAASVTPSAVSTAPSTVTSVVSPTTFSTLAPTLVSAVTSASVTSAASSTVTSAVIPSITAEFASAIASIAANIKLETANAGTSSNRRIGGIRTSTVSSASDEIIVIDDDSDDN